MNDVLFFKDSVMPDLPEDIDPEIWSACCQGLQKEKGVLISYEDWNGDASERTVFPEVIFEDNGNWYAAAFCALRQEPRTFRFDRICSAVVTEKKSSPHGIAEEYKAQGIPWKTPLPKKFLSTDDDDMWDDDDDIWGEDEDELEPDDEIGSGNVALPDISGSEEDLRKAVLNGDVENMLKLLSEGADANAALYSSGESLLMLAADHRGSDEISAEMVKILLAHGVALEQKNNKGRTALFFAVTNNKVQVVKLLLEAGADPDARERVQKFTPLLGMFFMYYYDPFWCREDEVTFKMVKLLCEAGADVNLPSKKKQTPLMFVGGEIMEYLISRGADVNAADIYGNTVPMFHADSLRDLLILEKHGADMNVRNAAGEGLLSRTKADYRHISFLIRRYGFSVNEKDSEGKSILQRAIENGDVEAVRFLVGRGAEVTSEYLGREYYRLPFKNDSSGRVIKEIIVQRIREITRSLIPCCEQLNLRGIKKWICKGANLNGDEAAGIPEPLPVAAAAFLQKKHFSMEDFMEICDCLISAGAWKDQTGSDGASLLGVLLAREDTERIAEFLEEYKKEEHTQLSCRHIWHYLCVLEEKQFIYSLKHEGKKAPLLEMMISFLREKQ